MLFFDDWKEAQPKANFEQWDWLVVNSSKEPEILIYYWKNVNEKVEKAQATHLMQAVFNSCSEFHMEKRTFYTFLKFHMKNRTFYSYGELFTLFHLHFSNNRLVFQVPLKI